MKIYINGDILDEPEAKISVFDRGFLYGDGIFETMRSYNGAVFRIRDHLDRLYSSMKELKIRQRLSNRELEKAVYNLLLVNKLNDASIRVTVSRGVSENRAFNISKNEAANTVIVAQKFLARPSKFYNEGIKIDISRYRRSSRSLLPKFKALNYLESIIARNESMSEGSFETVFLNESGYVCEGTVSNIFMVNGNKMLTPAVGCGVLPGVTRKVILESAPFAGLAVEEGSFDEDFLKESEEVFITNSIIELVPVVKIGSKIVGNGKVGPVAKKMHKMYSELIKSETGQGESINK